MVKIFISYAHEDEKYKDELAKHMSGLERQQLVEEWNDRKILAGDEWDEGIKTQLNKADIILFLVSKNFLASDYINNVEIANAIERHKNGKAQIIPIYVNFCLFEGTPISEFTFFPQKDKPIEKWANKDEGWLEAIKGVLIAIAKTKGVDANQLIAKYNIDKKQDEKEVFEKYNLRNDEGQIELGNKIKGFGIEGPMGNYQLVNINREEPKDDWWDAYDEKVEQKKFFQFYFMTSCPTQMPPSFAERMIYEVINEELEESPEAIHYEAHSDNGRVVVRDFTVDKILKRNLAKTKERFKKYFVERFSFQQSDFDFDKFIQQGVPTIPYQYVASVFKINATKWEDFLPEFFTWVVDTFQSQQNELADDKELPTFIFFFVINIKGAHLPNLLNESHLKIISDLEKIATDNSNTTIFKKLKPVLIEDVTLWFDELGESNPDKVDDLINSMVLGLDAEKQRIYENKKELDMSTIELLQELVYKIVNG